jgi:polysaccharide export outer membrane protein
MDEINCISSFQEILTVMLPSFRQMAWLRIAGLSALCALGSESAYPQGVDLGGDAFQRLLQGQLGLGQFGLGQGSNNNNQPAPSVEIYQPVFPQFAQTAPPSRLEGLYSARAGRPLTQFGYDILGVPTAVTAAQVGGVQDDYILNEGDEIIVDLRGQDNATYRQRVDRDGRIILPKLSPIQAVGRTFAAVRADLETQVGQVYISTRAFASVGQIRQVSILVAGEVRSPGTRVLSGLATPLDAILLSGGIAKTGSLRNVTLIRNNRSIPIDLYALLLQGTLPNVGGLRNGDRIYVPPIHDTVAIAGFVRRAGIYELSDGQRTLDANTLVQLAGGFEIGGTYRLSKISLESDGSTRLISLVQGGTIANGEVLFVDSASDVSLDRATIAGAVRLPGAYPRASTPSVGRLIRSSDALSPDAYAAFAIVARRDPRLNVRNLIPFSLVPIFAGTTDIPFQNDDVLYVFRRNEIRLLAEAAVNPQSTTSKQANPPPSGGATSAMSAPQAPVTPPQLASPQSAGVPVTAFLAANGITPEVIARNPNISAALASLGPDARIVRGSGSANILPQGIGSAVDTSTISNPSATSSQVGTAFPQYGEVMAQPASLEMIANTLGVTSEALIRMAKDHVVWVMDAVRDPGPYVAGEGTTLGEMLQFAGGVLRQADLSSVEVTSTQIDVQSGLSRTIRTAYKGEVADFQKVSLRPFDVIRLRPVFSDREDGQVSVAGQVRYPGAFDITRGERLSSVLQRAGGYTDSAYPYGAVFTRERAAATERDSYAREARAVSSELANLASSSNPNDRDKVSFLSSLSQQIQNQPALGRITITADSALLRVHPELDIILEPGDKLYVPTRPVTVTVSGEVLNNGSFQYTPGADVRDYITVAGGVTQGADEQRIFVVLPDGTARPVAENWLTFNNATIIPPGSTVIVPRDLRPFDLTQFLKDATQITSQLGITAASLAVIGR